jgi:thymidylate synthase (FAD)
MNTARLVWATEGGDQLIAKMARVSNPGNQDNAATAPKLIKYLIEHKHWSPFEMVNLCVEIETTRSIAAQLLRHRSFSFQEFSQRYADATQLGALQVPCLRRQDLANRQNSIDDLSADKKALYYRRIQLLFADSEDLYREMVSSGVAKECAREVLPMATPSRLYMNGNARSWIHYIHLRTDPSTQLEHRHIAEQVKDVFCKQFPDTARAANLCAS